MVVAQHKVITLDAWFADVEPLLYGTEFKLDINKLLIFLVVILRDNNDDIGIVLSLIILMCSAPLTEILIKPAFFVNPIFLF